MKPGSFEAWMKAVDRIVYLLAGCSAHDLSDQPYAVWHEDGMSPKTAARRAVRSEMGCDDE